MSSRIAAASPLSKVAVWLAATFVCTWLIRLGLWGLGLLDDPFEQGARIVPLIGFLIGLTVLISAEPRPIAAYGLAISEHWGRHVAAGFALGASVVAAYFLLCLLTGAMRPPGAIAWWQWLKFLAIVPPAMVVAFSLQVIFSGFVVSLFHERYGAVSAVAAPAVLLPLFYRIDAPHIFLTKTGISTCVGLMLFQALCALLRLRFADVMFAGGLTAGVIVVQRTVDYGRLLRVVPGSPSAVWLCPAGDLRQSLALWALLVLGIAAAALELRRAGERPPCEVAGLPSSLKRIYPFASPMILASLPVLAACLAAARGRVGLAYLPRLAAMMILSTINTILTLPERLLAPLFRRRVSDPIFIVGVHRSGTTHLHNLLSLDPNLIAPRNFQVLNPAGFLLFGWPMAALLAAFFPWRRPMDAMHSHLFSANEEEFAIANLCRHSPYWGWVFPAQGADYDRFLFPEGFSPREKARWRRANLRFLEKLVLISGKRPVLKNPCNTGRISMLLEMFPDARLIHIHRHPYDVYRSNEHLAREGQCLFQLQDPPARGAYTERFPSTHVRMEQAFYEQAAGLPPDRVAEIAFEDLERDAAGEIARVYGQLNLEIDARFRVRLRRYLRSLAGYRKNRLPSLPAELKAQIDETYAPLMRRWGYIEVARRVHEARETLGEDGLSSGVNGKTPTRQA